ncbi:MAG: hypothetical protein AAGU77_04980 [Bacillota bacterium]
MKRVVFIACLLLILALSACSQPSLTAAATPTPTFAAASAPDPDAKPTDPPPTPVPTRQVKPYDPSIFVIQASKTWREEIAPNYFVDYSCDIYLHKIDANDNRATAGSYQGTFWMEAKVDASGFISDMLKDVPVAANFEAGGEAVCDNLGISLNTTDDKAWVDYSIPGADGKPLPLTQDTPVGKGSFVTVAKSVYLEAKARGAQGEKVDYSTTEGTGDETDVAYVVHVQPDSAESNGERTVVFYLTTGGQSFTVEGTMRRLPGYPEDVDKYLNSQQYHDNAFKNLE